MLSYHPTGFSDIQLMWPISIVGELIFCQSPFCHFVPHLLRYLGIIGQKIHKSFLVFFMLLDDLFSALVASFGIVVIHSDKIGAEWAMIICVGFAVGYRVKLMECFSPTRSKNPCQQFIFIRIIIVRFGKRHTVVRMVAQTHTKAIGLHTMVTRTIYTGVIRRD